jgi:hypothetical protein
VARSRWSNDGVGESLRSLSLDEDLLADPDKQRNLLNEVRVYGEIATDFLEQFGHPSRSPWTSIAPNIPSFRAREFLLCLQRYAYAPGETGGLISSFVDLGIETIESLAATCDDLRKSQHRRRWTAWRYFERAIYPMLVSTLETSKYWSMLSASYRLLL